MPTASTVTALSGKNRQEAWRDRLQEFASKPPEEMGDQWGELLKELGLTHGYYLAVQKVLGQRGWVNAESPRAYVKYAAKIEARKMHLSIPHKDDTFECRDSLLEFKGGTGEFDRATAREQIKDEEWFNARIQEEMFEERKPKLPHDWWIKEEPPKWYLQQVEKFNNSQNEQHIHVQPQYQLDWKRLSREAGLDQWEAKVLEYHRQGVSRDRAMTEQTNEESRLAIQAAWKRMDRTGLKKVRDFIKKSRLQNVPEKQSKDNRRMEATGRPSGGRLKVADGKSLQAVWNRSGGSSREDLGKLLSNYRAAVNGRGPTQVTYSR